MAEGSCTTVCRWSCSHAVSPQHHAVYTLESRHEVLPRIGSWWLVLRPGYTYSQLFLLYRRGDSGAMHRTGLPLGLSVAVLALAVALVPVPGAGEVLSSLDFAIPRAHTS